MVTTAVWIPQSHFVIAAVPPTLTALPKSCKIRAMKKKCMVMLFLWLGISGAQAFELKIGVLTGQLLFDVSEFDVEAGSEAKITFHNNGFISHNLIFL